LRFICDCEELITIKYRENEYTILICSYSLADDGNNFLPEKQMCYPYCNGCRGVVAVGDGGLSDNRLFGAEKRRHYG
jgi:hypothetical protein